MNRDTRTTLLDIAEYNARSRGFDGFSYADLAVAVGIRKASIHYHFPTKADLSDHLIARYHTSLKERLAEIENDHLSADERLMALIRLYREALNGGQTVCLCVAFSICRERISEKVVIRVGAVRAMLLKWIKSNFELGLKDRSISLITAPEEEACATLAMLEGAHLAARTAQDTAPVDAAIQMLLGRCRQSARKE